MIPILQVGKQVIDADKIISLLINYQMFPQLLREIVIDRAIINCSCNPQEIELACQQFYEQNKLKSEIQIEVWLNRYDMTHKELKNLVERQLKIEKFKHQEFGRKINSYFLECKEKLDRVVYSMLRTNDENLGQELYFRLQEGEQTFEELARKYSQGPEAETGGLIGPVELSTVPPKVAETLSIIEPGELCPLIFWGEWTIIVRLEQFIPARLDESTSQLLLDELFEAWLLEELNRFNSLKRIYPDRVKKCQPSEA